MTWTRESRSLANKMRQKPITTLYQRVDFDIGVPCHIAKVMMRFLSLNAQDWSINSFNYNGTDEDIADLSDVGG